MQEDHRHDDQRHDIEQYVSDLRAALDSMAEKPAKKKTVHPFFASKIWFFTALFSVLANMAMAGALFWQHMRIDYLVKKVIGE